MKNMKNMKKMEKMEKTTILVLIAVMLGNFTGLVRAEEAEKLEGTIAVSGAWALYPLVVTWAEEFKKLHPDVRIDISAGGAGKGMADALAKVVDLGMVSRDVHPEEVKKGAWSLAVAKDAVVPMMNEKNPELSTILSKGLKKDTFVGIWVTEKVTSWGQALGTDAKSPIHVYTRSDACGAAETWAKFMDKHQEDLGGVGVYGDPGLAGAVKKDPLGIGYNNVNFAYDPKTKKPVAGLKVLPIDVNGNGKLDADEKFYDNRDQLTQAIAEGKYPSPPARELYLVCGGKPEKKVVREFLKWVLTDGQKFVETAGYIPVSEKKLTDERKKLEK
jgi:phosphate transport system substrate-binding protein